MRKDIFLVCIFGTILPFFCVSEIDSKHGIFKSLDLVSFKDQNVVDEIFAIRDEPLFLSGGCYHFWDLQTIFFKSNAFQTIFFITFCDENNFLRSFL